MICNWLQGKRASREASGSRRASHLRARGGTPHAQITCSRRPACASARRMPNRHRRASVLGPTMTPHGLLLARAAAAPAVPAGLVHPAPPFNADHSPQTGSLIATSPGAAAGGGTQVLRSVCCSPTARTPPAWAAPSRQSGRSRHRAAAERPPGPCSPRRGRRKQPVQ